MLPPLPPPFPFDSPLIVHIASLEAALAKLNVKIPVEDLIKAIHDEDEARRPEVTPKVTVDATQRRAAMRKIALESTKAFAGVEFPTVSPFVPNPTEPAQYVDPLAKERRRIVELTEQSFPDGKFPDPSSLT